MLLDLNWNEEFVGKPNMKFMAGKHTWNVRSLPVNETIHYFQTGMCHSNPLVYIFHFMLEGYDDSTHSLFEIVNFFLGMTVIIFLFDGFSIIYYYFCAPIRREWCFVSSEVSKYIQYKLPARFSYASSY